MFGFDSRTDNDTRYRKSIAHAFGHGINIGLYASVVVAKEFSASAIPALNAVSDIHGAICVAALAYGSQKFIFSNMNSPNTLYTFYDYGSYFVSILGEVIL